MHDAFLNMGQDFILSQPMNSNKSTLNHSSQHFIIMPWPYLSRDSPMQSKPKWTLPVFSPLSWIQPAALFY